MDPTDPSLRVGIVHDYLTQRGGAERVVLTLAQGFPGAKIYTSCFEPSGTYDEFASLDVTTSAINRIGPIRRDPRRGILLLAPAFATLPVSGDALIVSSSAWAHGIRSEIPRVVYCHSPARWLHQPERYSTGSAGGGRSLGLAARVLSVSIGPSMRRWDRKAMKAADRLVVNSTAIARQVAELYDIEAEVLPPAPALISGGAEQPVVGLDEGFWLTVARLLPYKNVGMILDVARARPQDQFVIVGDGPLREQISRTAPSNVMLRHEATDDELRWMYRAARGLVAPAFEDFGLTPIEAASFGTPTIALRALGHLDTIVEGTTGLFFDELNAPAISAALDDVGTTTFDPVNLRAHADRFGAERFINRMHELVREVVSSARR